MCNIAVQHLVERCRLYISYISGMLRLIGHMPDWKLTALWVKQSPVIHDRGMKPDLCIFNRVQPRVPSKFSSLLSYQVTKVSLLSYQVCICALSGILWAIRWWMSSCRTGHCLVCIILPSGTSQVTGSSLLSCRYYFAPFTEFRLTTS